jgi:hypothetical protein
MNYYTILAALLITILITWVLAAFSKRGLRGFWLFFVVVFLATWAGQLWITPFGPQYWGVNVFSLLLVAVFFSFFIFTLVPFRRPEQKTEAFFIIGIFFWVMIVLLITSIIAGYYYRSPEMQAGFYYQPPRVDYALW